MQGSPYPNAPPAPSGSKFPLWLIIILAVLGLGVVLVGVLAALGVYGTRRYLAAAKTAEAKNSIGAIARGARYGFEIEQPDGSHKLCGSAVAVPAMVPSGKKYMPATGADFDTGDAENGWKCLKFSMTTPIYYQYHYNRGAGYLAPAASPGPNGFEAAARGDLDGDGTTSLFALTGTESGGALTVSASVHIENEFE
jgi:type IV pilus assembly protein PilA